MLWLLLLSSFGIAFAGKECVWVIGQFKCEKDESKAQNVEVRVLDRDSVYPFKLIDPDDLMGVTFSNEEGHFSLDGCGDDFDWIPGVVNKPDPYITIRHYCNKEKGELVELPEFYTFTPKTYDLGILLLDAEEKKTQDQ